MSNPLPKHDLTPAARMSPNRSAVARTRVTHTPSACWVSRVKDETSEFTNGSDADLSASEKLVTPRAAVAWNRASYSSVDAERVMRSMACIAEWAEDAMELRRPFYNYPFSALRAIRDEARACILANTNNTNKETTK